MGLLIEVPNCFEKMAMDSSYNLLIVVFFLAVAFSFSLQISVSQSCDPNENVYCKPSTCCPGLENTCCEMPSAHDNVGCCPTENGVCCTDSEGCCPEGFVCTGNGKCGLTKPANLTIDRPRLDLVPGLSIIN